MCFLNILRHANGREDHKIYIYSHAYTFITRGDKSQVNDNSFIYLALSRFYNTQTQSYVCVVKRLLKYRMDEKQNNNNPTFKMY